MKVEELRFSRAVIFSALREHVESTSIRQVAREVGMSPTGLTGVLGGSGLIQPRTDRKLREWYRRFRLNRSPEDLEAYRVTLDNLLGGVPEGGLPKARRRIVRELISLHREMGSALPVWLQDLAFELGIKTGGAVNGPSAARRRPE